MNMLRLLLPTALLCLPLIACGGAPSNTSAGKAVAETTGEVSRSVKEATDSARREIIKGNITVSADGQPKAAISPDGHFLVNGKDVPVSDAQRALLKTYRDHMQAIALQGMDVGLAGAKLGTSAASEALKSIFSGDTDGLEARINAQAEEVKRQANGICARMPALLASQQALAHGLPAFQPYASMTQKDVDDCGKDGSGKDGKDGKGFSVNVGSAN